MAFQQCCHLLCGERLTEQITLHLVAVVAAQEILLLFCLDALGDDFQPQAVPKGDDALVIAMSSASAGISLMKERSILTQSIGKRFK